jgi:hypothetical protein
MKDEYNCEDFGTRITKIRVMVEKMMKRSYRDLFEISGRWLRLIWKYIRNPGVCMEIWWTTE